jgi:hypothetical protein
MGKSPNHKHEKVVVPQWAKDQADFQKKTKYPDCKGTFPDCPEMIDPGFVTGQCKMCPIYKK